jgi:hypothetical protein
MGFLRGLFNDAFSIKTIKCRLSFTIFLCFYLYNYYNTISGDGIYVILISLRLPEN